jgi:hypothetical protein
MGAYDLVVVSEGSEDAVMALNLKTASLDQYADTCTAVLGVRYGASRSDNCMRAVSL